MTQCLKGSFARCAKITIQMILSAKCHGATKMYSKNIIRLANEITQHYAKFNVKKYYYEIDINDISDFDLNELASQIMKEDKSLASEANGPDNPAFETRMLPALINFMANSTKKDESIEFINEWRDGVTSYFKNIIEELFDNAIIDMSENLRYVSKTQRDEDRRLSPY